MYLYTLETAAHKFNDAKNARQLLGYHIGQKWLQRVGGWHLAGGLGPPSYALAQANPRDWFQSQAPPRGGRYS